MHKMNRYFQTAGLGLLMCLNFIDVQAAGDETFANRVNLALRQVGHQLLLEQQDSTSLVPPVENGGDVIFLLPMKRAVAYQSLPKFLKQAFIDYDITEPYTVMLRSCESDQIVLGFNAASVARDSVPCLNREQAEECVNLWVQFPPREETQSNAGSPLPWLLLPMLAALGIWGYRKWAPIGDAAEPDDMLRLGQFRYDPVNQLLLKGDIRTELTFRENKLLHLLAAHPNQVLTRADIQAQVWEEEGVIVGRSLDVFVSRLRKLLKADPAVQIKSVHGVGYRLECP